jgi:GNAT superfamily N-acetyltransferase
MRIVPGHPDDLDLMVAIRREVAAWLKSKGSDQWGADWPDTPTMVRGFEEALARGETWFAVDHDGEPLGVVTVNDRTDPGLWTPDEVRTALFVHRMTVRRCAAGRGLGRRLLDHAADLAQRAGRSWIRLDCWTTNTALHRYYMEQGFRHVRTVLDLDSPSTACFEREAQPLGRAVPHTTRPSSVPHTL